MMTLKAARTNKGYTQATAAQMLGVSKSTLANYEKGKCYPDIPTLIKIEKLYGVPYSDINFLPANNA